MTKEGLVYKELAKWLVYEYPNVLFHFDFGSGVRLPMHLAKSQKSLNPIRGYPDFHLSEPTARYKGLYIEIKHDGDSPYLKRTGELKDDEHLKEQKWWLDKLTERGYFACFGVGVEECKSIITSYLEGVV